MDLAFRMKRLPFEQMLQIPNSTGDGDFDQYEPRTAAASPQTLPDLPELRTQHESPEKVAANRCVSSPARCRIVFPFRNMHARPRESIQMNPSARLPDAAPNELPREVLDLGRRIAALPEPQYRELEQAYARVVDCVRRRRRILELVQEALAQLRLDIKYLMFDLDATRKERDEFKAQLDELKTDGYDN